MGNLICFAYVVMFLKLWSYVHVNYWCRLSNKAKLERMPGVVTGAGTFDGRLMAEMVPGSAPVLPPDADEDEAVGSGGNSLRVRKQSVGQQQPKSPVKHRKFRYPFLDCILFCTLKADINF